MKNWRFYFLVAVVFLCFGVIIFRLFFLQVTKHSYYKAQADSQHQNFQPIYPARGEIFMRDKNTDDQRLSLFPVAINKDFWKISIVPREIQKKEETVKLLSPLLETREETLRERINKKDDPYEPLKSKVEQGLVEKIKALNLEGILFDKENWRYYPNNDLVCHLIGFLGMDGDTKVGRYGVEGYYEKELMGKVGLVEAKKDSSGEIISVGGSVINEPEDGADLILTIDPNVSFFIEGKLAAIIKKLDAVKGTIIVMEVKTGAIRAMSTWPGFDPNKYNEVENNRLFVNSAISEIFEPGSIFKPITMAAALDAEVITPNTTYEDKGYTEVGGIIIKNALDKAEGVQTMTQVIEKSLNSGAIFVQQKLGKDGFRKYVEKFGFGEKTGIDLGGEEKGNISNLKKKNDVDYATMSFGQGIAVTPIQLVAAIGAIANDGILLRPYILERIKYKNGEEKITQPKEVRRVISSDAASRMTAMMVSAVKNGYSKKAGVEGYLIAGKTGTAQIPDPVKGNYSEETIHTFIEFFPAFNPRFVILIKVDKPKGINFSSDSITPLAKELTEYLLNYYEIPPSQ
ncbi:MAG: penicillin-binding protein 2 [bacterium]|nr:penicillin-binding protein 2 [bacterium]